jgi:peptidoglycan-N-acetylglucosamine deacetylase
MEDLLRLEEHLYRQVGFRPEIIRFPGGSSNTVAHSSVMREIFIKLREHGYDYFDWNVSAGDAGSGVPAHILVENVITQVDKLGGRDAVILLHDHYLSHATAEALPRIIEALRARGYEFAVLTKGSIDMKHRF